MEAKPPRHIDLDLLDDGVTVQMTITCTSEGEAEKLFDAMALSLANGNGVAYAPGTPSHTEVKGRRQ